MKITVPQEIEGYLKQGAPVAIGVSGGKDSCAVGLATIEALNAMGHQGPRILIHSDLGMVEWEDSFPACQRIAEATGTELVVVRRKAGGMMERWEQRWANNVTRYEQLLCVKLILPWSTPAMKFCTGELKRDPICSELRRRFGGCRTPILSVTGVRADESPDRAKQPVFSPELKLVRKSDSTSGFSWRPIHHWKLQEVFDYLKEKQFQVHDAYAQHGSSRVSCIFCIMSSGSDLVAAAKVVKHAELYRRMVLLEITSSFSFQSKWLADVNPGLLDELMLDGVQRAKEIAKRRVVLEKQIPKHLEYKKGWPDRMPTPAEADLIALVRSKMGAMYPFQMRYIDGGSVFSRYEELMKLKEIKDAKKTN